MSLNVGFTLELDELYNDSARCRAILQNNEDKIEEFNKWSENMVRFVKTILDEASKMAQMLPNLENQMNKFTSFRDAFDVHKTVESFDTISNLLRNTQSSNYKLITNISSQLLIPLQKYFQEDFRSLKDSRKSFDKISERYDGLLNRYYGLSKFKDVSDLDEDLAQLYENRILYYEQYTDHVTKINNFKETIDILFLEKITILIDDLSDFFKNLSENFHSVKLQLDKGRGEFERLNSKSNENRSKNENDRIELLQKVRDKWNPTATIVRKLSSEKVGNLLMKRKKTLGTPWKRIYALISKGEFSYEIQGRIRGTLEIQEKLNVMMCEIRPIDFNDRRFCFELYTGQQSQIYQAESEDDMMDWINTFHSAKSEMVQKRKSSAAALVSQNLESIAGSIENSYTTLKFEYGSNVSLKKWNEDLHKHFPNLLESEVNLCSFPASLHTDIWTQGRVFVSQYAVYFFSSLFGIGTKIIIPLKEIMKIDIVQTSFVTVVNFTLAGDSKDLTLKTFNSVDDSSDRFIDHLQLLHKNTQSAEARDAFALFNEMQITSFDDNAETDDSIFTTSEITISSLEDEMSTKEVECGCSSHMEKRSVNTIIPIDCALAFELMFGPKCPVQHSIQARRKNRDYKITDWKVNDVGIEQRSESYMFPLNNPLVRAKETECYVTLKLTKNIVGRCYIIDCKTNTPNIPYADSFYTQTRYCITWAGPEQTRISICLGIVWLKSPFVKSIIKSATLKTFEDTCTDYMACLRKEIASKIGVTTGIATESALQAPEPGTETDQKSLLELDHNNQIIYNRSDKFINWILNYFVVFKIPLIIFFFAFFLGRLSRFDSGPITQILTNYDLELEVFREFNISRALTRSTRSWTSPKFKNTHSQLNKLHDEFGSVRKSIWYSLQKINELERKIYQAEVTALLGDRLLACYEQDSPACIILQKQWKEIIKNNK